jgi:glucose-6-phosphate 1-dehydrogenase
LDSAGTWKNRQVNHADPATYQALRRELGNARAAGVLSGHPAGGVRDGRGAAGKSGCTEAGARVIVEKPFGTDLASAQRLNGILLRLR